jgi:hypothetical protein
MADGAMEQDGLLGHDADMAPERSGLRFREVHPIPKDPPLRGPVEPRDQVGQGALPPAGRTHQGDDLPFAELERDLLKDRTSRQVLERDPLELDRVPQGGNVTASGASACSSGVSKTSKQRSAAARAVCMRPQDVFRSFKGL